MISNSRIREEGKKQKKNRINKQNKTDVHTHKKKDVGKDERGKQKVGLNRKLKRKIKEEPHQPFSLFLRRALSHKHTHARTHARTRTHTHT